MTNATYAVLDERLEERPDWVAGELYIGGAGLARGYWRDEERTRSAFVRHPVTGTRLYRSGDLGRWLPGGVIEFVGRADFQVKIQGQRIELGEVEAALEQHPGVRGAVVRVWQPPRGGKSLVGYVVPAAGPLEPRDLERALGDRLPAHMVPSQWVTLDALPLSPNGKLDRAALPDPAPSETRDTSAARASSPRVRQITTLAEDVLRVPGIEPAVSLLSYGANSIDLVRLGNRLEEAFGTRPRIDEIFRLQTVQALADYYEQRESEARGPAGDALPADGSVAGLIASYRVLLDPAERDAFKDEQRGIRTDIETYQSVALTQAGAAAPDLRHLARRSQRTFSLKPVPVGALSQLLQSVSRRSLDGKPKYRYASAGSLYPNQVYLHVKPGRVDSVPGGISYYDPIGHRLVTLSPHAELSRDIHIPFINTPVFDEAAFSIFIVAQLDAIAPMYGDRSLHFVTLEAGIMSHLLEETAAECGLGLCHIGSVEFDRVRHLFRLDDSHILVHSMVGGLPQPRQADAPGDGEAAARLLAQVQQLSPDEVRRLLEARRAARDAGDGA
jgi:SagB-type dehydrogenase family enzyme